MGIGSLGKLAAGNMYVGNYLRTDGSNGVLNFGKPFTQRPTRLKGYFKYTTVPINKTNSDLTALMGQPDTCQIYIALGDWSDPVEIRTKPSDRKVFDKNDPHVIAYAEISSGESVPEYTPFTLELEYRDTSRIPLLHHCGSFGQQIRRLLHGWRRQRALHRRLLARIRLLTPRPAIGPTPYTEALPHSATSRRQGLGVSSPYPPHGPRVINRPHDNLQTFSSKNRLSPPQKTDKELPPITGNNSSSII